MSLINQMLRDLQDQKSRPKKASKGLKPKALERIPYLPLPLVLGASGIVFVLFIWWLAGALSEVMFGFEPAADKPLSQVAAQESTAEPSSPDEESFPLPVADQLTLDERMAEPETEQQVKPQNLSDDDIVSLKNDPSVEKQASPPVTKKFASKRAVSKKPAVVKTIIEKQSKRDAAPLVKTQAVKQKTVTAVKTPARLHPDELPGAIRNPQPEITDPAILIDRPDRVRKSTPYGQAQEAYLDGLWALDQNRKILAIKSLQNALQIYPGHLPARETLAELFENNGQSGEAIVLTKEGLEIAPDYVDFKKRYARLMMQQADYDAAIKALLQKGLPGVDEDPEVHTLLASLYQKLGEFFLAAQTYRNLLVAWPQTGAFWVGLGTALEGQNLTAEAIDCYERALRTDNLRDDLSQYTRRRLNSLRY